MNITHMSQPDCTAHTCRYRCTQIMNGCTVAYSTKPLCPAIRDVVFSKCFLWSAMQKLIQMFVVNAFCRTDWLKGNELHF